MESDLKYQDQLWREFSISFVFQQLYRNAYGNHKIELFCLLKEMSKQMSDAKERIGKKRISSDRFWREHIYNCNFQVLLPPHESAYQLRFNSYSMYCPSTDESSPKVQHFAAVN